LALCDVDVRQLFELMIHARQLPLDVLGGVRDFFLDPLNVKEHAAVRAAAAFFDFAHDAPRHMVAGKQLRRAPRILVALAITPPFLGIRGGLGFVIVRDVTEHEAFPVLVQQDAAFAAHPFGDENAHHARRPDHAGRVELHELHVNQLGPCVIGE